MARDEYDTQEARPPRAIRRDTQPTDRLSAEELGQSDLVNPNWRRERATGRNRRAQTLPSSRQEVVLWLQDGGWRLVAGAVLITALVIVLLVGLGKAQPLPTQTSAETEPLPTEVAIIQPFGAEQPSVTPPQITPAPPPPAAQGGAQFRVFNTGSLGLFLRSEPSTANQPLKTLNDGAIVTIVGADFVGPDRVWKHIRDADGTEGWVAADFLQPAQ